MDTHLSLAALVCAGIDLVRARNLLRKYGLSFADDPEEFLFCASLEDFDRMRACMLRILTMFNVSAILWWLP